MEIVISNNVTSGQGANFRDVKRYKKNGWDVWSVKDQHALTQVAGWLRFNTQGGLALYRGQASLHPTMLATGLRGVKNNNRINTIGHAGAGGKSEVSLNAFHRLLGDYIDKIYGTPCRCGVRATKYKHMEECGERLERGEVRNGALVSGTYRAAVEPLLQHYGVNTRWIDVVDNIWVALWFACHRQITSGRFAHHQRRSVAQEKGGQGGKAYIVVMETGKLQETAVPGYKVSEDSRFIDLRYAVPSIYLRPHAQHGLLIAPRSLNTSKNPIGSLGSQVIGVIEVELEDALLWLGEGGMTTATSLFPPATYDEGYRRLLEFAKPPSPELGNLTYYGPGE